MQLQFACLTCLLTRHLVTSAFRQPVSEARYFPEYSNNVSSDWVQQALEVILPRGEEKQASYQEDEYARNYHQLIHLEDGVNRLASLPSSFFETTAPSQSESRVGLSSINTGTIYTGVFDPNNILIHVSQNFINFVASTITWFVFLPLYQGTGTGREGRNIETGGSDWLAWLTGRDFTWALRRIADTADIISQFRDEL